jgi:hypothetical protein
MARLKLLLARLTPIAFAVITLGPGAFQTSFDPLVGERRQVRRALQANQLHRQRREVFNLPTLFLYAP